MDHNERELYVSRIISGRIGIKINGKSCFIAIPEPYDRYVAQEIFFSTRRDAGFHGVLTTEEMREVMIDSGLWSEKEQEILDALPRRIENLKAALYEAQMNPKLFEATRKTLDGEKDKHIKLSSKEQSCSNLTQDGTANTIKLQYILYTSIIDKKKEYIHDGDNFWDQEHSLIEEIFKTYLKAKVSEDIARELARTEPWRSYWGAAKAEGSVFGASAADLTQEQRSLINWSKFYDSIYEHMESPAEKVIQDDDLLDGWLILQNRKRERAKLEQEVDKKLGKNRGAQEVYLMAGSIEEADKIHSLNSPMAKGIKRSREVAVEKHGSVPEEKLPDAKKRIRMQAVNQGRKK